MKNKITYKINKTIPTLILMFFGIFLGIGIGSTLFLFGGVK